MKRNIFTCFLIATTLLTGCATTAEETQEVIATAEETKPAVVLEATPVVDIQEVAPFTEHKESIIEYAAPFAYVLEYPSYGNDAIDEQISDFVLQLQEEFTSQYQKKQYIADLDIVEEADAEQETDTPPPSDATSQENCSIFQHLSYEAHLVQENLLSITLFEAQEVEAIPLSLEKIHTLHFDIRTGERLWETDFISTGFAESITEYVVDYFQTTEPYSEKWAAGESFAEKFSGETYQQFALSEEGLLIHFPAYTFLPNDFGRTTVVVPYEEIDGFVVNLEDTTPTIDMEETEDESTEAEPVVISADIADRDIDPDKPMVALTFDDGPHPEHTMAILDVLAEYDAVATFFELGSLVESYPDVVRRQVALGNELGNHSYSHKSFNSMTDMEIAQDYEMTSQAFMDAVGFTPTFFRPPYGYCNEFVQANMPIPCVTWSVDTLDWESRDTDAIMEVLAETEDFDGAVILMHDIYESTVDAVEILVPQLIDDGYQLVTLSELFEYHFDTTPTAGNLYGYAFLMGIE